MLKISRSPQTIIEYPLSAEYIDLDGNLWSYRCYVQMTCNYEVRDVVLTHIEVEDIHGNIIPLYPTLTEKMKNSLRDNASQLALEKIQSVDFESEGEND